MLLHLRSLYNSVTFPTEGSGKFNPAVFVHGATHEVQGNAKQGNVEPQASLQLHLIQKTILLAKVSLRDVNKPSSSEANRLMHTVIASINVTLDHSLGECNVETVADMVLVWRSSC